jgi:transposase-like protein
MVRKYIKKRSKPEFPEEAIEKAVKALISTEMNLREAAAIFGLNPSTLYYRVQKAKKEPRGRKCRTQTTIFIKIYIPPNLPL